jgi:NagD protein
MKHKNYLIDMDGVLVRGGEMIPGADIFINQLIEKKIKFLILTNNPIYTPVDLAHRLQYAGLDIKDNQIFSSAMATARFLNAQKPKGKAFVIGESGLTEALHEVGYILTEIDPDYVVLGETNGYNFDRITLAIRHVMSGAHFLATNPDASGPTQHGVVPACGAMAALIEKACGKSPFFIGKPNPLMMRAALNYLGVHSENTVMVGDRMDTDIIAGIESGMETILVLTGMTREKEISRYPYQPRMVVPSVGEIEVV